MSLTLGNEQFSRHILFNLNIHLKATTGHYKKLLRLPCVRDINVIAESDSAVSMTSRSLTNDYAVSMLPWSHYKLKYP